MLALKGVGTFYGPIEVLKGVSLEVGKGEIVSLLGANAAGKTTTMKTIFGIVRPVQGSVEFSGTRIDRLPIDQIVLHGIALVPEGRRVFPRMTVSENLEMGAFREKDRARVGQNLEWVLALFPRLKERLYQQAGTLSGGEQQMLAMGRALMASPTLLCLDEPSMGLAPLLVERVFETIVDINRQGVTIFMVEQNAQMALSISHRGYVLETGQIVLAGTAQELLDNESVRRAYLGT